MREKLIDIVEAYADFLDWDTKEYMVDSIMEFLATDNNVGHKWIPVTERLPVKESQAYEREWAEYPMYIVMIDKAFLPNALCFDWRDSVWFDFRHDGTIDEYEVTHWMPLPEPPKGE